MRKIISASLVFVFVFLSYTINVNAGGPFIVDKVGMTGVPCQWLDNKLVWKYDEGPLSNSISNKTALSWIRDAMDQWAQAKLPDESGNLVSIANVTHQEDGGVGQDINTADYVEFLLSEDYGKYAVIVFDADGSILEDLGYSSDGILGLTLPTATDSTGLYIIRGIILLNGSIIEKLPSVEGIYTSEDLFKAALLHEVGHLYNLDHTQVNLDTALSCTLAGTCEGSQYISTMFPELKTYRQGTSLSYDDRISLSWIYPNSSFENSFCTVVGEIQDKYGKPLQGVNVVARYTLGTADPKIDARSMVSGVSYPACTADGFYYLKGLRQGRTYHISYEPLSDKYVDESGFEPFHGGDTPLPPSYFDSGTITSNGATTVTCEGGGQIISMDTVKVDVDNPCSEFIEPEGSASVAAADVSEGADSGGSKCSLVIDNEKQLSLFPFAIIFISLALMVILRRYSTKRGICHF